VPSQRRRILLFGGVCLISVTFAVSYIFLTAKNLETDAERAAREPSAPAEGLARIAAGPHILFLQSDGDTYRRVALTGLGGEEDVLLTPLQCQRVHQAAGRGLCLKSPNGGALIFDRSFERLHEIDINGLPSRARVSPDGRLGAITVFVQGHSYADGAFSTRTAIVDMTSGDFIIHDLEELTVFRDGRRFEAIDFNFWGVTFAADGNTFYATLGTGGNTYLLQGDLARREARILRSNVECPSLSPDGTRLVFKKRITRGLLSVEWRLHVLDLATMNEVPLAETRNVDDQVEWLDNNYVLYYLPDEGPPATIRPDVWVTSVSDTEPPRRLLMRALSPVVVKAP
jgi:hypothetical protein